MAEPPQQKLKKYPKLPSLADPFLIVLIICLFLYLWVPIGQIASAKTSNSALPSDPSAGDARTNHLVSADQFKKEIQKYIGIPYRMGGTSLKGIDCSGLIKRIYAKLFGIAFPHNSSQQSRLPFLETVSAKDLKTGDLIFFGPRGSRINHVGVYLAEGRFMHAGRRLGVTIASLNTNYWRSRFIVSKRIQGLVLSDNNEEDLHPYAAADYPRPDSGISHGLHYRPSDDRRYSVSARHEWDSSANFQNNSLKSDTPQNDLQLQLDFSF